MILVLIPHRFREREFETEDIYKTIVPKLEQESQSLGPFIKTQTGGPHPEHLTQWVCGGAREFAFLTSCQEMLRLLAQDKPLRGSVLMNN